jgi:hypothetical protein
MTQLTQSSSTSILALGLAPGLVLALALAGCSPGGGAKPAADQGNGQGTGPSGGPSGATAEPATPGDAAPIQEPPVTPTPTTPAGPDVFRVEATPELQLPLQRAFAAALSRGDATFTVRLVPGTYDAGAISLKDTATPSRIDLVIEGEGPAPAVLRGSTLDVAARNVTLRNLVLTGTDSPAPTVSARVGVAFSATRIALVEAHRRDKQQRDGLMVLRAAAAGATATIADSWFVGNQIDGEAAVLATPKEGRGSFDRIEIQNSVFAGNRAATGIQPWFSKAVRFTGCTVHEPALTEAWLTLNSPVAAVSIEGGIVAAGAPLVDQLTSDDAPRGSFPKVAMRDVVLRVKKEPAADEAERSGVTIGKAPAAPGNWDAFSEPAKRAAKPDAAALVKAIP